MKCPITIGLILISILMALSFGVVFAEVSNDNAGAASSTDINKSENATNVTSINITNDTLPLNATKNVTNPFAKTEGCII